MGEELKLRQGIGRIDTQVGIHPRRHHPGRTANLDAPANPQAIRDALEQLRGDIEVAIALEVRPEIVAKCGLSDLDRPVAGGAVNRAAEVEAGAALRQMLPA
jgi:hypothetical protein